MWHFLLKVKCSIIEKDITRLILGWIYFFPDEGRGWEGQGSGVTKQLFINYTHSIFLCQGIHIITESAVHGSNMVFSQTQMKKIIIQSCFKHIQWPSSHRLCDVDFHDGCGAEGRRASITGLNHHRPPAVLLSGDVLHNLHRFDVRFELNLSCGCVDVEDVVWIGCHDWIFNDVIGFLCVLIHSLNTNRNQIQIITFTFTPLVTVLFSWIAHRCKTLSRLWDHRSSCHQAQWEIWLFIIGQFC